MDRTVRILHFESDRNDALLVNGALLEDNDNFQICVVDSGQAFLTEVIDFSPDIILAGNSKGSFNCKEQLTVFCQTGIKIPLIILTDPASETSTLELVRNGADDYIFKDRLSRLPSAIHSALAKFRHERERLTFFDELVISEKRYRALIESSTDAVVILNEDGKPNYVSAAVSKVLGYSQQEVMQMDLFSIMHPDDFAATALVLEKVLASPGIPVKGHTGKMLHKDGRWRWIEATVTNFLNDPAINGIVDNFRDVTETKLNEEKYRLLFETSMDGILLTMKNGNVIAANDAACNIFQMSVDEIKNAGRSGLVDFEDPLLAILLKEREENGKAIGELTFKRRDGTRFPGEISSTVFKDAYGSENTSMIIRDITERKAAELRLSESEQFNKSILSSLTSHIAVIDDKGNVIAVNRAWDDFAKGNGEAAMEKTSRGANYFRVCEKAAAAGITDAEKALAGILSVFRRDVKSFELEYSCHSPAEKRWFILHAMLFGDDNTKVVLSHQNITALKVTQEKLVLSESRLNQAQSIAKIGSWEVDLNTLALIWSEETYCIFGAISGDFDLTLEGFLSLVHTDDRVGVEEAIQSLTGSDTRHSIEHRIITVDGVEKIVEENWQIIKSSDGVALRASGTCQEITQRRKGEELVVNSRSNLNAIIENTEAFIYSLDGDFHYITFNSRLKESMKNLYGVEIYPGYNIFDFINTFEPDGVQEWCEIYARALTGEIVKFEREFFANDEYTYTSFSINPMWKDNAVIGLSCYVHDITDEKKANDENKFQANLLDTIGQAAIATNLEGSVIFWNKAAEKIYGWKADEALQKNILELTPTNETRPDAEEIMALLKTGQPWSGEFRVQRKNGTRFPASITNSPIYDQHHRLNGIIGVSSDITEKKALEDRLDRTSVLARIGNYEIDLVEDVVFLSPMTRLIFETKTDFIADIGSTLAFFKEGHYRNTVTKSFHQAKETGAAFDLELQIVTTAGHLRWTRIIGQAECIDDICVRIYGSIQDIDKIKIAEQEILKVYEEKNVILESIGDAFFAVDQNWIVTYWNSVAENVLGKTKLETHGHNLWDLFSDSVGSESHIRYQQAIDTDKAVHFEDYYPALERWYEVSAYPSANLLSVYIRDITNRKETLSALEESERNYSGLFNLSPLPMWVFDIETLQFLDVNEAALSSYGYSLAEFLSITISDIRPDQDLQRLNQILEMENIPGRKLVNQGIFRHKKKDGTLIQVEIQSNLIQYKGKSAKIVIASDMTERYNYIQSIEEQNTKLREIAWMQSHVVRAPLARIMGLVPMIKDADTFDDDHETLLDYLLIAAYELDDVIKNISDKTR